MQWARAAHPFYSMAMHYKHRKFCVPLHVKMPYKHNAPSFPFPKEPQGALKIPQTLEDIGKLRSSGLLFFNMRRLVIFESDRFRLKVRSELRVVFDALNRAVTTREYYYSRVAGYLHLLFSSCMRRQSLLSSKFGMTAAEFVPWLNKTMSYNFGKLFSLF